MKLSFQEVLGHLWSTDTKYRKEDIVHVGAELTLRSYSLARQSFIKLLWRPGTWDYIASIK